MSWGDCNLKDKAQPTMKDVAQEAGVSLGTVSRVFNGAEVGEDYRRRVEEASARLGYHLNTYARALKIQRSMCIALVLPSLRHPFFARLADELTAALARENYRSLLMITNYDEQSEQRCFALARQNIVEGVFALTYSPDFEQLGSIPVVSFDRQHSDRIPCVASDNFAGGRMAAERLIALGCRRLLFLRIGPVICGEVERRGLGFESACKDAGVPHELFQVNDTETEAPIYRFLDKHVHEGRFEFDGIFCNTDGLALRVMKYLAEKNIRIPDDVQLIGYDGILDFATGDYVCSTIVQPVPQMAAKAVDLLLHIDQAGECRGVYRFPVQYAAGGTTREPRTSSRFSAEAQIFDPFRKLDRTVPLPENR